MLGTSLVLILTYLSLKFRQQYFGGPSSRGCMEMEPPSEVAGLPLALLKMMQVKNINIHRNLTCLYLFGFPRKRSTWHRYLLLCGNPFCSKFFKVKCFSTGGWQAVDLYCLNQCFSTGGPRSSSWWAAKLFIFCLESISQLLSATNTSRSN